MNATKKNVVDAYMTIEAALVMSVVIMVYVFLIDSMIFQYERCVEELEAAVKTVRVAEEKSDMYEITTLNPVLLLRMQRAVLQKNQKEEEKVE